MKKAVKISVRGTIPAMFFSSYIKENADKLCLRGFVREIDSGSAEVIVEGEIEMADRMSQICSQNTQHMTIKEIKVTEIPFQDFKDFKILHI
ncbi:MAG TPA: acylphosphatase [Candidatus Paceibacterota bacterium]|nr:acylphosphatase [Candidatus Paceibacterota bacterium]